MGMWSRARSLAGQTPESRNRYVDFLRAVSILVVVTGHWLIAPFYVDAGGSMAAADVLVLQPRTQWLTWLFQVMPIFFIVGGYANAVSLESASRKDQAYAEWLSSRLNRLVSPLLLLLFGWAGLSALVYFSPVSGVTLQMGSRAALIPIWFLAIYLVIVVLAPLTYRAWRRWGYVSVFVFAGLAALDDYAFFSHGLRGLGWINYLWVWLAVHQLGYAWRAGRLGSTWQLLLLAAAACVLLLVLVFHGPYPLAMVGSPDEDLSNTLPPKFVLIVLGVMQLGLLLAIEGPMRRLLGGIRLWTATVLVNSMIMTLYLWHLTVMVLIVALSLLAGGFGLHFVPASPEWWATRPVWIASLYALLLPVTLLLSPLERRSRPQGARPPAAWRQVIGAILICLGVALLARFGFGNAPLPYLDIGAFLTVIVGSIVSGLLPGLR